MQPTRRGFLGMVASALAVSVVPAGTPLFPPPLAAPALPLPPLGFLPDGAGRPFHLHMPLRPAGGWVRLLGTGEQSVGEEQKDWFQAPARSTGTVKMVAPSYPEAYHLLGIETRVVSTVDPGRAVRLLNFTAVDGPYLFSGGPTNYAFSYYGAVSQQATFGSKFPLVRPGGGLPTLEIGWGRAGLQDDLEVPEWLGADCLFVAKVLVRVAA